MKLIVSTCGTSVLTNLADPAVRSLVVKHANVQEHEVPDEDRNKLAGLIASAKARLISADIRKTKDASAELNGILSLASDQTPLDRKDVFVLLHTDTWLGTKAAELIAEKLESYGSSPQLERVVSLNTRSLASFNDGLRNIVDWTVRTIPGYRDAHCRVIFNLVGGFKSVQGFMQTLGMFHADEIVYIFESGSELLRIPRLPVNLDAAAKEVMTRNALIFRRLDVLKTQPSHGIPGDIPESLLYTLESETELSPWGKLLWSVHKPTLYAKELLAPASDRIRFTNAFRRDVEGLPAGRLGILNERIDDLTIYMESVSRPNLKRLDVKQLKCDPMPPSTHEADAWADADCRRIFFHFEDNIAILDRLTHALH